MRLMDSGSALPNFIVGATKFGRRLGVAQEDGAARLWIEPGEAPVLSGAFGCSCGVRTESAASAQFGAEMGVTA